MLSYFKVHNYRSILDANIDLKFAEGKAPNGYHEMDYLPFWESKQIRCVPALAVFGANGSGKSNLLEAINVLRPIILRGNGVHNNYIPNKLNNLYKSASFELEFIVDKNVYNYFISYDEKQIEKETLIKNKSTHISSINNIKFFSKKMRKNLVFLQNKWRLFFVTSNRYARRGGVVFLLAALFPLSRLYFQ